MAIPKHNRQLPIDVSKDIRNQRIAMLLKAADVAPPPAMHDQALEDVALNIQEATIALRHLGESFHSGPIGLWENGDLFVSGLPVHPRDVATALLARVAGRRFAYEKNGTTRPIDQLEELKDHSAAVFDVYALNRLHASIVRELGDVADLYETSGEAGRSSAPSYAASSPSTPALAPPYQPEPAAPATPFDMDAFAERFAEKLMSKMNPAKPEKNPEPPPAETEKPAHDHKHKK